MLALKIAYPLDRLTAPTVGRSFFCFNNVVFDFEGTKFMDSSGIGIILGRYKKIACFGGKVFAINADSRIRHLLMISGLHKIMEIMD